MTPAEFKAAQPIIGRPPLPLAEWSCLGCGMPYSEGEFYHRKSGNNRPLSRCKKCYNLNLSRSRAREMGRAKYRRTPRGLATDLVSSARQRSSDKVTITPAWVSAKIKRGFCEVTGIPFDLSSPCGQRKPFTPSIDQIVPGAGYTPENTQVVCWMYNAAKGPWGHEDVVRLAKALLR